VGRESPVITVAGIANPARFASDLRAAGWQVAGELTFADHHRYTAADTSRIAEVVRETGARAVLTTAKDAVRFEPLGGLPFPLYSVPMTLEFDPRRTLFDAIEASIERQRVELRLPRASSPAPAPSPEPRASSRERGAHA
jgi:tetraacyldisaccharide 4'-kinase